MNLSAHIGWTILPSLTAAISNNERNRIYKMSHVLAYMYLQSYRQQRPYSAPRWAQCSLYVKYEE